MSLKESIIEDLKDRKLFAESDELLIDELLYNFDLIKIAKKGIADNKLVNNITRDPKRPPYFQKTPWLGIYDTCLKNVQNLYSKLSIAPQDRARLKDDKEEEDLFDQEFD